MARAAAVVWVVALAALFAAAGAAEAPMGHNDAVGLAVAVLAAGLVLSARLGAGPPDRQRGTTDYG